MADVWTPEAVDARVRPNMVIAAALEWSPLSRQQRAQVVERAQSELLTPRGLRTLATGERGYRGTYAGGPEARDGAYHQGTVWPWLLGFYVEASLRARGEGKAQRRSLAGLWAEVATELDERGLNHLSEVFGGDPPARRRRNLRPGLEHRRVPAFAPLAGARTAVRILMLGWEFPPELSGGLGTACQGLTRGLSELGAGVTMVLPSLHGTESAPGVELLSAAALAVGRLRARRIYLESAGAIRSDAAAERAADRALEVLTVQSPLRPYLSAADYSRRLAAVRRGDPARVRGPSPPRPARTPRVAAARPTDPTSSPK